MNFSIKKKAQHVHYEGVVMNHFLDRNTGYYNIRIADKNSDDFIHLLLTKEDLEPLIRRMKSEFDSAENPLS